MFHAGLLQQVPGFHVFSKKCFSLRNIDYFIYNKKYLLMHLSCVIKRDNMFFGRDFYFFVCLRFKNRYFKPKTNKKVKITTKT